VTAKTPTLPFALPPLTSADASPEWIGIGFRVGSRVVPILSYSGNTDGWTDDLTALHEDTAGHTHPIDVASRRDAVAQLQSRLNVTTPTILDVGCSSGYMLCDLTTAFPTATVMGADVVHGPLERLAKASPGVPLFRFDVQTCPLPSGVIDAVVMLNVLEHVADDQAALGQVYRILKPGGLVVIEVPAGPHLFDDYDRALKHFRRYRLSDVAHAVEQAGFRVLRQSHLGFLLYPAFAVTKRLEQRAHRAPDDLRQHVEHQVTKTATSRVVGLALALEARLGRWVRYPFGIRCVVVGQRQ